MATVHRERLLSWLAACSLALGGTSAAAQSIRFFGTGAGDIDRVKIRIDDPGTNVPGPPADVGADDFTIEFWLRAPSNSNSAGPITCGSNNNWIRGNIVFDRDRFNQGRAFGISLGAGRVAFGIDTASDVMRTICGSRDLRDDAWHHVAVQRDFSTGQMTVYVDGQLDASGTMPANEDVSYPNNGVPGPFCGGPGGNQPCTFSDPFIVLGAEKHDAGSQYPSFTGWVDELRISTVLRYSSAFTPPAQAFTTDADTAALYHFDEPSGTDVVDQNVNLSPGFMSVGASGPLRSPETPFGGTTPTPGTLALGAATYTAAENAANVTLTALRVGGSSGAVSVNYATTAVTATPGADYTTTMGTATWANGDAAPKSIVVPLIDDATFEGAETFAVALDGNSTAGGATLGSPASATVTLTDNDAAPSAGVIELTADSFAATEGAATVTITVRRVNGSSGAVSVSYSTDAVTATPGADYTTTMGTAMWANGDTATKSIVVPLVDDAAFEGAETFRIVLDGNSITGGATLGRATTTVTLTDNEPPPPAGVIELTADSFVAAEGDGTATITVRRVNGLSGAVSVSYSTSAVTATAGSDYTTTTGTATWANGDAATKSIVVPLIDDALFEGAETFAVVLDGNSVTGGATLGRASATVTLSDNEAPPPAGVIELTAASFTAAEGDGTATITLRRVNGSSGAVSVSYSTSAVTATAGSDYTTTTGTATWANGNSATKSIVVPLIDDAVFEGTETFAVVLDGNSVTGGATLGRASATVTLADNEPAPPAGVIELAADSFAAAEGDGTLTITVRRVGGSNGNVSVAYATANGTATPGADYLGASGTLSWSNGETANKTFVVTLIDDTLVEGTETIAVTLSNVTGGAALGTQATAQLSVNDDDSAGGGGGTSSGGGALDPAALATLLLAAGWRLRRRRLETRIIS